MKFLKTNKSLSLLMLMFLAAIPAMAQDTASEGSGDKLAELLYMEDKMVAVACVLTAVLLGMFIYLFSLDRKIKRLEKLARNR